MLLLLLLLLLTAIGLSPGGSGYFTCIQNVKMVTNKFKSGGLREKHVVAILLLLLLLLLLTAIGLSSVAVVILHVYKI